ncbi:glycerophosphodiester phosphodiesterase [Bacillus sp. EB106-08-02-XG196]|jgi:glycerophosphoryl diester phosphodiesterase|uniref:glycerophosphodiester phosphodiesterase n=1 Tax=Bacillus sp. EB106-08-02-XG196 TaxID=2737049 RepID=UPI0015C4A3A1|nr:glycerophosphodiester phosphodiesterase [Bacillus sp. EB106-08-02-XG196]NWQ40647.1 glycerophosphodiester phosphodiesterase [Bacillus sp. EB106-08-02-XG196]
MQHVTVEKARRKNTIFLSLKLIASALLIFLLVINLFPVKQIKQKSFFNHNRPMVIAHQGGELLAPSNTMAAFQNAANMGVDVLETDIHITKDGHLVAIHDASVDRTTNGKGQVEDLTLAEIQELDAGYHFKNLEGNHNFRGKGVYIPTVKEMFQTFNHMKIEIEIKDDNPPERIEEIASKLWNLIEEYQMEEKILIGSFDQEILKTFDKYAKGRVALSAGRQEVKIFVITHKFLLRNLYVPKVDAFQIPVEDSGFDLTDQRLIDGAHRLGMEIHYWTIDDPDTMEKLIDAGADGILTNRPDLLHNLIEEKGF